MAYNFNNNGASAGDYITLGDAAALTLPDGDWTIGGWLWDDNVSPYGDHHYFISWGAFGATPSLNLWIQGSTSVLNRWIVTDNGSSSGAGAGPATPKGGETWLHVIIERSGTVVRTYLDNVSDSTWSNASMDGINVPSALNLGRRSDGNTTREHDGKMEDWFKVDRALDAEERQALADGFSSRLIVPDAAWRVPMDGAYEEMERLTVTVSGATLVEGQLLQQPAPPLFVMAPPSTGLSLHDAAANWDETSAPSTTYTVTSDATMLVVCVTTELVGSAPSALNSVSSSIDGAFDAIAFQSFVGGSTENRIAVAYLLNPSAGSHNISFSWGGTTPPEITVTAFSLTGTIHATPVGSTGSDSTLSSGVFSVGSLSHSANDFGVFAAVYGFDNVANLSTPDGNWTEQADVADNSSNHFVQTRDYSGPGTDTATCTYSGSAGREMAIAVIFQGGSTSSFTPRMTLMGVG